MAGKPSVAVSNLARSAQAPRCERIKMNGLSCAAPALRGRRWCLFHSLNYEAVPAIGVPEDASSIQVELGRVIRQLQSESIPARNAGLILYALQIASQNLLRLGAELPMAEADLSGDELVGDLLRRLNPQPEHAAIAWLRLKDLVRETTRPYDPALDDGRIDRPAAELSPGADPSAPPEAPQEKEKEEVTS
jgi:hypothetical protein